MMQRVTQFFILSESILFTYRIKCSYVTKIYIIQSQKADSIFQTDLYIVNAYSEFCDK